MAGFFAHGAGLTFNSVAVGGLLDVPVPSETRAEVETTDQDSNFRREFVPGLIDSGTMTFVMRMVKSDAGQAELRTNLGTQTPQAVVVTAPGGTGEPQWSFNAYVQELSGNLPWENTAAERTCVLRLTGGVTEGTQP